MGVDGVGRRVQLVGKRLAMAVCGAIAAVGIGANPSPAADQVEIIYGPIGIEIDVDDLEAFVEGEETSRGFRNLVRQIEAYGDVSPEVLRTVLGLEIDLDTLGVNRARAVDLLYGFIGKRVLSLGSDIIYPPLDRGNLPALRGAIVLSLMDDGKISVVEVLRRYGVKYVRIDAGRALDVMEDLQGAFSGIRDLIR